MTSLRINEIFYSLQGEGRRAGEASIFVRLAGCDLACGFCDTEFESGKEMTLRHLLDYVAQFPGRWIVWTGGEPLLQLTPEVTQFFADAGYLQAVESNGNHPVKELALDWVVISPKVAEHVVVRNFQEGEIQELRYAWHKGKTSVPQPAVNAEFKYLSPIFDGSTMDRENLSHCIDLCKQYPDWRLSVQLHKLWKVL